MSTNDLIKELQELALGTRLKRLSDTLMSDVGRIYKEQELDFEPRWFTMLYLLNKEKSLSIIAIAENLKLSHPAVVQFADQMLKQKLVIAKKDKKDARKRILELSNKGKDVYKKLQPILIHVEKSTHELIQSTGVDVLYAIDKMEKQLHERSMYERVKTGIKEEVIRKIKILPYQASFKNAFRKLNEEWLTEYFVIEKEDKKLLEDPEKYILEKGGFIFFALNKKEVVGTVAFIKQESNVFELSKMAVSKSNRGNTIGQLLMKESLLFLKDKKVKHVFLETNRILYPAIHLYEKFGFSADQTTFETKYKRSNLRMSLFFD